MKKILVRAAAIAAVLLCAPAIAQNIAVVNNKPIPKSKYDELLASVEKQGQPDSPELEAKVKDHLITTEILLQEANKEGIPNEPEVQQEIDQAREQILIRSLVQAYLKANPPTDAELHAQYDQAVRQTPPKEYHAHHILVQTDAEARALIAKLKAGAKFEDLAKANSKDPGSAPNGGDLGWSPPDQYDLDFSAAMIKLQKGQFTQTPVKTQFGYHIIRLDDSRDAKIPTFDEAKPRLVQMVMQNREWQDAKVKALIADLKSKAKIE